MDDGDAWQRLVDIAFADIDLWPQNIGDIVVDILYCSLQRFLAYTYIYFIIARKVVNDVDVIL